MSKTINFACWNVNGLRSVIRKGSFSSWLNKCKPDIFGLQETKLSEDYSLENLFSATGSPGYLAYFVNAERAGYSGVGAFTKIKPSSVSKGIGKKKFDSEGRLVQLDFPEFSFLSVYYPNGKASQERLAYKMEFYDEFLKYALRQEKLGKRLVICGDFNTSHKEIDLARPKENREISGFLAEECAWMDKFVSKGFLDCFRYLHPEPHKYTWWSQRSNARERNVGWRLDYFFISNSLKESLISADIKSDVMGSDHCPISITLRI